MLNGQQTVFALVAAFVAVGLVFEMLRRRRLREKYAVIWILIGAAILIFAIWPGLLTTLSRAVGIDTPSNLLFVLSLAVSFFVALQLSSEVGDLEEETRTLAEEVGLLRMRLDELRDGAGDDGAGAQAGGEPDAGPPRG
ncbi:MAG: DUF2304 domain-containing protein [Nocardioides sp.]